MQIARVATEQAAMFLVLRFMSECTSMMQAPEQAGQALPLSPFPSNARIDHGYRLQVGAWQPHTTHLIAWGVHVQERNH